METPAPNIYQYYTPTATIKYSASYFSALTFQAAAELQHPQIYDPKTVSAWAFTHEIGSKTSAI
jgi:hypothetical protein